MILGLRKKMGYGCKIIPIIFLIVGASLNAAEVFNLDGWRERENVNNIHIEKVSGEDENQESEVPLILEKFRALLGLKMLERKRGLFYNGDFQNGYSPSPSPTPFSNEAEAPAPAPAPVHPIHTHSYGAAPHRSRHRAPAPHKIHKEESENNGGRAKRILVAVLVSAGATSILSLIGIFWGCRKFRKQRRKSSNSVKKVISDPAPELFYLESLGTALDPQPFCLKRESETVDTCSNDPNTSNCALNEVEVEEEEETEKEFIIIRSDSENVDNYSAAVRENVPSVHDSVESITHKEEEEDVYFGSPIGENVVIPVETHSSSDDDGESFHSLCNSHTSNSRLSNASVGSLVSDTSEIVSSPLVVPKASPSYLTSTLPQPPPPPPPPPPIHISPSHSTSSSTKMIFKAFSSSTLANLSSPKKSDSSSGSNQTPKSDLTLLTPPTPPKPPVGIPPPPCLPPFSKGPPPPPSQFPQQTPMGKDGIPLPKLKPLHWDKVRAAPNRTMVWDKLRSSSFEFDEKMIESLFGYNLHGSNEEAKSKSPSPSKHVLEPKRLQNITILSKALNATTEQVCHALIQGNGLDLQQLEALIKMEPTKEEESKLRGYKGNTNELGSAEKFVTAILKIPYAFLRIEAMLYRETFEDEVVHLRKSFSMLEEACKELRSSRLFLKLLEAVLKTGNRMNVGTIRGGARAFKLDALLKLADVKGTDGKTTLLHFVVQEIVRSEGIRVSESIIGKINQKSWRRNVEDREEDYKRMGLELVSGLSTELCNVKKTATIDLDVLASSVSNLSDGMTKLQRLNKDLSVEEKSGNFVNSMKSFLVYADKNLKELQEDEHKVLVHVKEITEYFHGNLSKDEANPLRIFVIVRDFLGMLDHVCRELRSLKVPSHPNPLAPFR